MSKPIPESYEKLVWIDYRVFFANMPYISVHPDDHRIIQSTMATQPKEFWIDCLELTFDGADIEDPLSVLDYMFDHFPTHKAVLASVVTAREDIYRLSYFSD